MKELTRRKFFAAVTGTAIVAPVVAKALPSAPDPPIEISRIAQPLRPWFPPPPPPEWFGDPLLHTMTVRDIARSMPNIWRLYPEVLSKARKFYDGDQWDEFVQEERVCASRPTLTINYLPRIASRAIENSRLVGEAFSRVDLMEMRVVISLRNRDAQKMYNYMMSQWVEHQSLFLHPPHLIVSKEITRAEFASRYPLPKPTSSFVIRDLEWPSALAEG